MIITATLFKLAKKQPMFMKKKYLGEVVCYHTWAFNCVFLKECNLLDLGLLHHWLWNSNCISLWVTHVDIIWKWQEATGLHLNLAVAQPEKFTQQSLFRQPLPVMRLQKMAFGKLSVLKGRCRFFEAIIEAVYFVKLWMAHKTPQASISRECVTCYCSIVFGILDWDSFCQDPPLALILSVCFGFDHVFTDAHLEEGSTHKGSTLKYVHRKMIEVK